MNKISHRSYRPHGKIRALKAYLPHGKCRYLYEDGTIHIICFYYHGKYHGEYKDWDYDGR